MRNPDYFDTNLIEINFDDGRVVSFAIGGIASVKLRVVDENLKEHESIGLTADWLFSAVWQLAGSE